MGRRCDDFTMEAGRVYGCAFQIWQAAEKTVIGAAFSLFAPVFRVF
jgi:hypothetical protein